MNIVHAHLDSLEIKINTNLEADEFFNEYKYLEFRGKLYTIKSMIKSKRGVEVIFESYSGPVDGDVEKIQ